MGKKVSKEIERLRNKPHQDYADSLNKLLVTLLDIEEVAKALDTSRSTLTRDMDVRGYKLIENAYILVKTPILAEGEDNMERSQFTKEEIVKMNAEIKDFLDNYKDAIVDLLDKQNSPSNCLDMAVFGELAKREDSYENKTFRVNSNLLKEFDSICTGKFKGYKKQEIINYMLMQFVIKYKD